MSTFGRSYELFLGNRVSTVRYYSAIPGARETPLQIKFLVDQTPNAERSYAEITLYGLNRESRKALQEPYMRTILKAGYGDSPGEIFRGEVENVEIGREGPNVYAKLFCQSAAGIWRGVDVDKTFGDNTPAKDIIRHVAQSFGRPVEFIGDFDVLPRALKGATPDGDARNVMRSLARTYNFSWMVEGDKLVIIKDEVEERPDAEVFRYKPTNGLVGTPQMTEKGVDIDVLLNPRIRPRDVYTVESETAELTFSGIYYQPRQFPKTIGESRNTVLRLQHEGDFYNGDWLTKLTGRIPGGISAA